MAKLQFTKHGPANIYGVATRNNKTWVLWLAHGLSLMPPNFVCEVCAMCKGQTCRDDGFACRYCEGTGLTQGFGCAATDSMRNQVLVAASRSLLVEGVVVR